MPCSVCLVIILSECGIAVFNWSDGFSSGTSTSMFIVFITF